MSVSKGQANVLGGWNEIYFKKQQSFRQAHTSIKVGSKIKIYIVEAPKLGYQIRKRKLHGGHGQRPDMKYSKKQPIKLSFPWIFQQDFFHDFLLFVVNLY